MARTGERDRMALFSCRLVRVRAVGRLSFVLQRAERRETGCAGATSGRAASVYSACSPHGLGRLPGTTLSACATHRVKLPIDK